MTAAQVKALPWQHWLVQIRAVMRIELGKSFFSKRSWWIYLAVMAPVILTAGHSIASMYVEQVGRHALSMDVKIFAGIFQFGYLRVFLFFGCAILFTNLFRGEVLNKTLHFYFLSPIRREVLAAGKYLSGLVAATTLYCLSVALAHITMYMHFGPQFYEFYFQGPGLGHLFSYVAITALACIGYGAVFTVMGLIFRNPMIPAAIVLVWEGINPFLPPLLKKFSVLFYLTSMAPVDVPAQGPMAFLAQSADPVSTWIAVPGLLIVSILAMIYAGIRTRKFEVSYVE
jgi:ABC-type transport system involved in multi-copper enzyme maturation permease subunit